MKARFLAASLLFVATGALAQTIYSKVDSAGHLNVSDLPFPAPDSGAEDAPAAAVPKAPAGIMRSGSQRDASVDAKEAQRRLTQAQLKRRQGLEPLPRERAQSFDGTVNYPYWRRQEKLRLEVERAQQRANATGPPQPARR